MKISNKKIIHKLVDFKRRDFLKFSGKFTGIGMLGLMGFQTDADAGYMRRDYEKTLKRVIPISKENFPPGIHLAITSLKKTNPKDATMLYEAYRFGVETLHEKNGNVSSSTYRYIAERLDNCSDETIYKQPAWWYIANVLPEYIKKEKKRGLNIETRKKELLKNNPALSGFEAGMSYYFSSWNISWAGEKKEWDNFNKVETNFLDSIFEAANIYKNNEWNSLNKIIGENKFDDSYGFENMSKYQTLNLAQKTKIMQYIQNKLKNVSYNQQLIAAWSAYTLNRHYVKSGQTKGHKSKKIINESGIMFHLLEVFFYKRKIEVRGPPIYKN